MPLDSRPFMLMARELNISEEELLVRIRNLQDKGIIRRVGAVLRHHQAGFQVNALVAWKAEEGHIDEAGQVMAEMKAVSHCYLREVPREFPYKLFTMLHARSEEELLRIIETLAARTGLTEFVVLKSLHEFKKVSMSFFKQ